MRLSPGTALAAVLALSAFADLAGPLAARAQISVDIQVNFAPPPLPVYEQPPIPDPDYLWIPGYWAWDADVYDYYWVPGMWAPAPQPGLLWTPPYWGWDNGEYGFHAGYWADHIGYYGGIAYGFGYNGRDYDGGEWRGGHFFYNRAVNTITNVNITNVYTKTVIVAPAARASFNGPGGVTARPTPEQMAVARERHVPATPVQVSHVRTAAATPTLRASANHGVPPVAATAKPGAFTGPGVVRAARAGGAYHPPAAAVARQAQVRAAHGGGPAPGQPARTEANRPEVNAAARPSDARPAQARPVEPRSPEARSPEARAPEARAPEARAPEARAPEARAPEAQAPEAQAPEAHAPEARPPEGRATEVRPPERPAEPHASAPAARAAPAHSTPPHDGAPHAAPQHAAPPHAQPQVRRAPPPKPAPPKEEKPKD